MRDVSVAQLLHVTLAPSCTSAGNQCDDAIEIDIISSVRVWFCRKFAICLTGAWTEIHWRIWRIESSHAALVCYVRSLLLKQSAAIDPQSSILGLTRLLIQTVRRLRSRVVGASTENMKSQLINVNGDVAFSVTKIRPAQFDLEVATSRTSKPMEIVN